jgi:uncharacterized membrane protein YqjE
MIDELIKSLSNKHNWSGLLISLLNLQYRILAIKWADYRKHLLMAAGLWALGFAFITVSLACMTLLVLYVWWKEYPVFTLASLCISYGTIGVILLRQAWCRFA